jgi:hypothetical protein
MVIELRTDVKHIDVKISELVEVAKANSVRICELETYNNQEIGRAKGVASTATVVSIVVSIVISIAAVLVSAVF